MNKIIFLSWILFCSLVGRTQDNRYVLYNFKGNVTVVENKLESKAKIGKSLSNTTIVKIPNGAAATFICNEAAMFTVKSPGNYSPNQFKDSCATNSSSVSVNYVKYVWNQLTSHEGSPGSNRKAFMSTVGAVSRSINNIWIDPRLDSINYSGGDFPLSWKSYADAKEFEFVLYTNPAGSGSPLYKNTLEKMKIPINTFASKIKPGNTYYWTSAVKGESNDEIKVLNYVPKPVYDAEVNKLKAEGPAFESEADQSYRIAFGLEDARYLAEAYQYYTKAAALQPDNILFRSTLMSFKKDYEIK